MIHARRRPRGACMNTTPLRRTFHASCATARSAASRQPRGMPQTAIAPPTSSTSTRSPRTRTRIRTGSSGEVLEAALADLVDQMGDRGALADRRTGGQQGSRALAIADLAIRGRGCVSRAPRRPVQRGPIRGAGPVGRLRACGDVGAAGEQQLQRAGSAPQRGVVKRRSRVTGFEPRATLDQQRGDLGTACGKQQIAAADAGTAGHQAVQPLGVVLVDGGSQQAGYEAGP